MCVAVVAWQAHPDWLLVAAANRDEYHERPTAPLARWDNGTIAGRDLRAGGTWLGVTESGRLALVTNFRAEGYPKAGLASRGALVTDWLQGGANSQGEAMNPFNLLLIDSATARIVSNWPRHAEHALPPGVHGLSNGAFERPWPKARRLCADLAEWLADDARDLNALLTALRNEAPFSERDREDDGPEPAYSGAFIRNPVYGTRCSTVVAIRGDGRGTIIERRFDEQAESIGETHLHFSSV